MGIKPATVPVRPLFATMIDISTLIPLLSGALIVALVRKWKKPTLPYPPGPKGYPILGNALDLATGVPLWEAVTLLANRHGTPPGPSTRSASETV